MVVAGATPSEVGPRGLAAFCVAGLVILVFGLALRPANSRLGLLGVVLGADMVLLFLATAVGADALVPVTGGLASVVLGPLWWVSVARLLQSPEAVGTTPTARMGWPDRAARKRRT